MRKSLMLRTLCAICLLGLPAGYLWATTLFSDAFTDGNVTAGPVWSNPHSYLVVTDPLNTANKVLQSPSGTTQTTTLAAAAVRTSYGTPLTLALRFNPQSAGTSWNSHWSIRNAVGAQASTNWNASGYGVVLNNDGRTFGIEKFTKDGGGTGTPGTSTVTSVTLASSVYVTGWNTATFTWSIGGALALQINGTTVLSGNDTTHAIEVAQVAQTATVNNASGYKLYFDDIQLTNNAAPTTLFTDAFTDGQLTSAPIWNNIDYIVVTDPLVGTNKVLSTPGGTTRTTTIGSTNVTPCTGSPLSLTLRINAQNAGDNYWNSHWSLRTTAGAKSGFGWNSSGYGFCIGGDGKTFTIERTTKDGSGTGSPLTSTVSTVTLSSSAYVSGWNTVQFTWGIDGTLKLYLNDALMVSGTDTTFAPELYQLAHTGFLNNNASPSPNGRVLYFDDITITSGQPAPGIHPRICLTPDEIPAVRSRISTNPVLGGYNSCLNSATSLGTTTSTVYGYVTRLEAGNNPVLTDAERQTLTSTIEAAALGCLLGEDATKINATVRALLAFVRNVPTTVSGMDYPRNVRGIAFGYDYLFNYMTLAEQQEVRQWLGAILERWETDLDGADYGFYGPASGRNYNWVPFCTGSFLVSSLALEGEDDSQSAWYTKAFGSLNDFLEYGIGPEGCPLESIHYFSYGMTNGAFALDAMARRGEPVFTHDHLKKVPTWWAHDLFPWGKDFNELQDTSPQTMGQADIYYRLMRAYPNDSIMKWVNANYQQGCSFGSTDAACTVLWAVPADTSVTAASLNLPLSGYFSTNGIAYMRTGWGTDDLYLEFQSDPAFAGPSHAHADRNSFTLMGKGRMWAIDGGGWEPQDIFHNGILIDGVGEGYFPHYGEITNYTDTSWYTAITGNAKEAYDYMTQMVSRIPANELGTVWTMIDGFWSKPCNPVQRANRTAVRVKGSHQYAMITDDIQKDAATHAYTWQMLSGLGNTYEAVNSTTCRLVPVDAGAYLKINTSVAYQQRATISVSYSISTAGNYKAWLLIGREYWTPWNNRLNVWFDTKPSSPAVVYGQAAMNSDVHWQLALSSTALTAGIHSFNIQDAGMGSPDLRIAAVLIAPDTFNPVAVPTPSFPANSYYTRLSEITPLPNGWTRVDAATNVPKLYVKVLNPSGVTFTADDFELIRPDTGADAGYPLFRLKVTQNCIEPKFRVFLYPYREGDPLPTITATSTSATISWPDGVTDSWTFNADSTVSGTRTP